MCKLLLSLYENWRCQQHTEKKSRNVNIDNNFGNGRICRRGEKETSGHLIAYKKYLQECVEWIN